MLSVWESSFEIGIFGKLLLFGSVFSRFLLKMGRDTPNLGLKVPNIPLHGLALD